MPNHDKLHPRRYQRPVGLTNPSPDHSPCKPPDYFSSGARIRIVSRKLGAGCHGRLSAMLNPVSAMMTAVDHGEIMGNESKSIKPVREPKWVTTLLTGRPDVVLMAPFMIYLVLLAINERFPESYMGIPIAIRGIGALVVVWLFRHHFPPIGKPHFLLATVAGVVVAAGWVAGQHLFNNVVEWAGLAGKYYIFELPDATDPRSNISVASWWSQAILRISVATITVAIVEEFFWRGFLLRAFIDWDRFDRIPLGTFTWLSFLGTSLLSMAQHPSNWAVSIFCWFAYNGLMYWKKSLLCMMLTHGITNLVLYIYVIYTGDWMFW